MKEGTVDGMYKDKEYILNMEKLQQLDHHMMGELWFEEEIEQPEEVKND